MNLVKREAAARRRERSRIAALKDARARVRSLETSLNKIRLWAAGGAKGITKNHQQTLLEIAVEADRAIGDLEVK